MNQLSKIASERIIRMAEDLLDEYEVPGAAVALMIDGELVLNHGIGHRDPARTMAIPAGARSYLYSLTKTYTAVAILRLVEMGHVALEDPIRDVLPDTPVGRTVSIRHLLKHTSGLPDYSTLPGYFDDIRREPGNPWSDAQFLQRTLMQGRRFPAGEGWSYSNIGYMVLRMAIERVTGQPFDGAMRDLVFRPLGMVESHVAITIEGGAALVPGYSSQLHAGRDVQDVRHRYHPGWVSHGVIVSTAEETARMLDAVLSQRVFGSRLAQAMHEGLPVPESHPQIRRPGYGLGLMLDFDSPFGLVSGHAGGGPGYSTSAFHFPDIAGQRVTIAALANRDSGDVATPIVFALVEQLKSMTITNR